MWPTSYDRHRIFQLALSPLRFLLQLPPIRALLEVQDWTGRHIMTRSLGGIELLPLYSIEQTKFAILHHINTFVNHETVHRSHDAGGTLSLQKCLETPFPKLHFGSGGP